MKLTLGQAAKEVGISKPSLSAAIKKGRLSAPKNEFGSYEIDPAELFRVYPPKPKANPLDKVEALSPSNPDKLTSKTSDSTMLDLLLAGRDKLIAEKDKAIERLEQEKADIRRDLEDQKEQAKRITLLLENKSGSGAGQGSWEKAFQSLEDRIVNQDAQAKKEIEEIKKNSQQQVLRYKTALEAEKRKPFWKKLFA